MLAEVAEYAKNTEEKKVFHDYLKAFVKLSKSDAIKCAEDIKALNNPKIKEDEVVKIVDLVPKDSEDLNKIFLDVTLTEEEANAVLEIIKKY